MNRLEFSQFVPAGIGEVWDFFSSPRNLSRITPPEMGFVITSPLQPEMYEGMFITYKVSPIFGIKLDWVTEITHVQPKKYFIDEQRRGPYSTWHHEHHFEEVEGGVEMHDILFYRVPFGFLGKLVNHLIVKNRVKQIFNYRKMKIRELFPASRNN